MDEVVPAVPLTGEGDVVAPGDRELRADATINTEGDIDAEERAYFSAVAAAQDGARPAAPWVVRWAASSAGVPVVDTEEVAQVASTAFADPRGWSLGGAIRFERVEAGDAADLVIVVAEADVIPDYSDACVSEQTGVPDASCAVGDLVIINDRRWRDGALGDAFPLTDFRIEEINHETGHWLGQGHFSCLGGKAAVNQQQFRSLDGCEANAWPLPWEQAMVAVRHGLWSGSDDLPPD